MNKLYLNKCSIMANYFEPFITCQIKQNEVTNENELYIIHANKHFIKLTGLTDTNVDNKKFKDACPRLSKSIFNWPAILMNSAMTNRYKIIEQYIDILDKYVKIFVFGYENGYFNVIVEDVTDRKLIARTLQDKDRQIEYLLNDLRKKNEMDNVTSLYNFQFAMDSLDTSIKHYYTDNIKFSVLLFDIINFKEINLKLGTSDADKLLVEIGNCIIANTRRIDYACRYSGDKFIILYNDVDIDIAKILFDRLKKSIKKDIIMKDGSAICYTIAAIDYSGQKKEELLIELEKKHEKAKLLNLDMILH